ncbi:MAG: glycosyltransferase [Candidatus Margulisbacteria bacterium]|jgi:glycosyltransferase involved in cell wall biosynthesis|nr:glycosyltransferase [Candidatus Margulisiibacteriota bacterium]
MSKAVSIIIPTYNRLSCLQKTLASLKGQTFPDFEVIVSDDGSTDGTAALKTKYPFDLKIISQANSGRAAARNRGFEQAQGGIIIFIDDHIILDKNFVAEHYHTHQKFAAKGVGVVRGRVEYVAKPENAPRNPPRLKKNPRKFNENSPFVNFITNNISVTREALELTGGFDPDFTEYGFQDQELGYRIRQRGIKYKVNPKAAGYIFSVYDGGVSETLEKRLDKFRQAGRSAVLFSRKHYWGGLQLGVNLFNVFLNAVFSLNNDWLLRICRQKIASSREKPEKEYWLARARQVMFLKGLREGFDKYPANKYQPLSGKKAVMLVSHQSDLSGAPISLVILANRLKERGYYPILVLPRSGPVEQKIDLSAVRLLKLNRRFFLRAKLAAYIRYYRPAVLHANTFLTEYALDAAREFGVKTVMHVREDLTPYPQIAKRLLRKADRIILISNSMVQNFDSDPTRLEVVYNAVEYLPSSAELAARPPEEPHSLLYIGSIEKRKGLRELAQAVEIIYQQNKRVALTVIGKVIAAEKNYLRNIQSFARRKGLAVIFAGAAANPAEYIDKTSLVVVPSLSEPFGRVIIEAMSRKKLVVATMAGGIPEIIEQYRSGFLVHPGDPQELAKMIMYVWSKPDEQKELVREKAYKTVAERFLPDRHADNIVEIYRRMLD